MKRLAVAIALCAGLLGPASGVSADEPWTFNAFQGAILNLRLTEEPPPAEAAALVALSNDLDKVRARYVQKFGEAADDSAALTKNLPAVYVTSMQSDFTSLRTLPPEADRRLSILQDLSQDLHIKAQFVASGLGLTGDFPAVISVKVNTVDAHGKNVSGLWVRCNPARYGVTSNPIFVFNGASTPTKTMLPPGNFVLWAEDAQRHVVSSQPIQLGTSGAASEEINFALP